MGLAIRRTCRSTLAARKGTTLDLGERPSSSSRIDFAAFLEKSELTRLLEKRLSQRSLVQNHVTR